MFKTVVVAAALMIAAGTVVVWLPQPFGCK
jgi:hypothetical protein